MSVKATQSKCIISMPEGHEGSKDSGGCVREIDLRGILHVQMQEECDQLVNNVGCLHGIDLCIYPHIEVKVTV